MPRCLNFIRFQWTCGNNVISLVAKNGRLWIWFSVEFPSSFRTTSTSDLKRWDPFQKSNCTDLQGVFGFDCFPSLIASIINTCLGQLRWHANFAGDRDEGEQNFTQCSCCLMEFPDSQLINFCLVIPGLLPIETLNFYIRSLGLNGPSFRSAFHCISKYYIEAGRPASKTLGDHTREKWGTRSDRLEFGWRDQPESNQPPFFLKNSCLLDRRPRGILTSFHKTPTKSSKYLRLHRSATNGE